MIHHQKENTDVSERMDCLHGRELTSTNGEGTEFCISQRQKQQLINQANEYINSKQWPGKASDGRLKR